MNEKMDAIIDRLPPQDINAEIAVLGSMLQEPLAVNKAFEILDAACFYRTSDHQKIFKAMSVLFEKGVQIDTITVGDELQRCGLLDQAGGLYYLTELVARVPSAANIEHHAKIVLEKYVLRCAAGIGMMITENAMSNTMRSDDVLDSGEQQLFELSSKRIKQGFKAITPVMTKVFNVIESNHQTHTGITGVATGFIELDELTAGLQKGNLIILAGRPSMGKTAAALCIARNASVDYGVGVGIFSLEMSEAELGMRLICGEARVDSHKVRRGKLPRDQFSKLAAAVSKVTAAPLYIDDSAALNILEIRAKARRLVAEKKVGLLVVDYLQLIKGPKSENKTVEIGAISQSLKAMAKELDVPVIALSQLSRAVEQRGGDRRPILSDLRESGAIEQDADLVIFVYRPEVYDRVEHDGQSEFIVAKQRNGPTGTANVMFLKDYVIFANLERRHTDDRSNGKYQDRYESESQSANLPF